MFISLPDAVLHVIQRLNDAGFEAYAVGGCVRDSMLGKTPMDWDVTTSALPMETQSVFAEFRTIETGLQHGTLTVLIDDMPIEITTYRIDGVYSDGRHPDSVVFTRSLAEDLRRRDFTVNAMAYHPTVGVVDLYDGQSDLMAGVLRCVGDAEQRFSEDALRIVRALRFASVLGYSIEAGTDKALRTLSSTLHRVAIERISVELGKLLCGQDAHRIFCQYADVLTVVLPEIPQKIKGNTLSSVPPRLHLRWAALLSAAHISSHDAAALLRRLRMDTRTIERVRRLLTCKDASTHTDVDLLRLLNQLDRELIFDYLDLSQADMAVAERIKTLLDERVCYKISMLNISGKDILQAGIAEGPPVGQMLEKLLDAVIMGNCTNEKAELLKFMQKIEKPVQ